MADDTKPAAGDKADPAKGTTASAAEAKPAEPTDDLVERKHSLAIGRKKLGYTTSTGRIVLREEVIEDGKFAGFKARATVFHHGLRARWRPEPEATSHLRLQWRTGLVERLAPSRVARTAPCRHRRRRCPGAAAL